MNHLMNNDPNKNIGSRIWSNIENTTIYNALKARFLRLQFVCEISESTGERLQC